MHNRVGRDVHSRDLSVADGVVLVPLVAVILALALYPQLPLEKSERDVVRAITPAAQATGQEVQAQR
jgi:NADH:ubiquinone oxidoreductase subunit 4 (subunit M)